jgi:hypothetical protein
MRMRATKRISNFQNWAAQQIGEVKKAVQEAIRSLIGKGGCPSLLKGGSDTRGIIKPTVDRETPLTHCQSSAAAIEQLGTSVTTLTRLVHTLRTKPSPPHSEANSNDLYCDDIPEPRNTDTADNVTPPTASSSTDAEQTGPTDTVEVDSTSNGDSTASAPFVRQISNGRLTITIDPTMLLTLPSIHTMLQHYFTTRFPDDGAVADIEVEGRSDPASNEESAGVTHGVTRDEYRSMTKGKKRTQREMCKEETTEKVNQPWTWMYSMYLVEVSLKSQH